MSARVVWEGLEDFKAALRTLPDDLATEAGVAVEQHARMVATAVQTGYPEGPTGKLRRLVRVTTSGSRHGASAEVRSGAPHANLFERGTTTRRTRTGASRGRMPQPPRTQRMLPKVVQGRARLLEALIKIVERAGFEVRR